MKDHRHKLFIADLVGSQRAI